MSNFITKPYYQQVNQVNKLIFELRKSNMDILKDQIDNPEIESFNTDKQKDVNSLINELEGLISKSIVQLDIISSITAYDTTTKGKYGTNTKAYQNYIALKNAWDDYNKSVQQHSKWQKDHTKWQKNEQDIIDYDDYVQNWPSTNAALAKWKKQHKRPFSYPEPKEPVILPQPATPLPNIAPKKDTTLDNVSLSTIPQIIDFRKAFAFFSSAKFRYKIIYDELLQFERFLNKENTKILKKLLEDLKKAFDSFIDKFFFKNADGDLEQINITASLNYGKQFVQTLSSNVNTIFDLFNEYYYNFQEIVSDAQNNPEI